MVVSNNENIRECEPYIITANCQICSQIEYFNKAQTINDGEAMFSITKFYLLQVILLQLNDVNGFCSHAHRVHQINGMLSHDKEIYDDIDDVDKIYDKYMFSPMSYDTYETDCYNYVQQPPPIEDTIVDHAFKEAVDQTYRYASIDNQIIEASGVWAPKFYMDMDRNNYVFESATKYVQKTSCLSKRTTTIYMPTLHLEEFPNKFTENLTDVICEQDHIKYPSCLTESLYRTLDGVCNNLERPLDGRAGDCMLRLLPADYKDGISQLRTSIDGTPLPNARLLSLNLLGHDDHRPLSTRFTQLHSFFGEFVITDNGLTLGHQTGMQINLQCCDDTDHPRVDHPQCATFFVPPSDDVLNQYYPHQKCMEFHRSLPCARCKLGPRKISSAVTNAQDLNSVYGVSKSMMNDRRTMVDGFLESQFVHGEELFAVERFNLSGRFRCLNKKCERSPLDSRNVLLPTGQSWALLFHRNHNRQARIIGNIKSLWTDEEIFQEARRWNIAQYQHCLYNEYIKTLIGTEWTHYLGILPNPVGKFSDYKPDVQLKTIIEFQSTAGRHGHTALTEDIFIIDRNDGREFKIQTRQAELFESIFYDGHISGMFLAQMMKQAFETTPSVPFKTFTNNVPGRTFGLDLGSLDIHRQRDHGIPGYINYLKFCHNVDVKYWDDLKEFIEVDNIKKLSQYYKYVEDVELYIGGHFERQIVDGVVGPTFACIIGLQFHNAKYGDRFFYEHGDLHSSFSIEQLNEIKSKSSLASILCKNTDLENVLLDPLRVMSETNNFVSCSVLRNSDFNYNL